MTIDRWSLADSKHALNIDLSNYNQGRHLGGWGSTDPPRIYDFSFFFQLPSTDIHIFTVGRRPDICVVCICLRIGNQLEQIGQMLPELFDITV